MQPVKTICEEPIPRNIYPASYYLDDILIGDLEKKSSVDIPPNVLYSVRVHLRPFQNKMQTIKRSITHSTRNAIYKNHR